MPSRGSNAPCPPPSRLDRGARAARRASARLRHAVFPAAPASGPGSASRSRRLRRRGPGRRRRPRPRRSSCCIARPWSMTTCPASTTRRLRRGKPSVHRAFGERLAVLAGDALIVLAFETLARGTATAPAPAGAAAADRWPRGRRCPRGIVAGQAWECEARASSSASTIGPRPARCSRRRPPLVRRPPVPTPEPWRALGERLGEAFQVADDLRDVASRSSGDSASRSGATRRSTAERRTRARPRRRLLRLETLVDGGGRLHPAPARAGRSCAR